MLLAPNLLALAVLGEVEGGDLLCLVDLALVGLDLLLERVDQVLHARVVLLVLVGLKRWRDVIGKGE